MRAFAIVSALILAACGDAGSNNADTGTVDGLVRAGGAALCDKVFECCPGGSLLFRERTDCDAFYDDLGQFLDDAVSSGKLAYDPNAADACLADFQQGAESSACDDLGGHLDLEGVAACGLTLAGRVPEGGNCTLYRTGGVAVGSDLLCTPGLTCVQQTCVHALAEGDACQAAADACAPPLACRAGHCARLAADGETCAADAECASRSCGVDQKCQGGRVEVTCAPG